LERPPLQLGCFGKVTIFSPLETRMKTLKVGNRGCFFFLVLWTKRLACSDGLRREPFRLLAGRWISSFIQPCSFNCPTLSLFCLFEPGEPPNVFLVPNLFREKMVQPFFFPSLVFGLLLDTQFLHGSLCNALRGIAFLFSAVPALSPYMNLQGSTTFSPSKSIDPHFLV